MAAPPGNSWRTDLLGDGTTHVWPLGDARAHDVDSYCWCRPTVVEGIVVHHSMDGREFYESDAYARPPAYS